MSVVDEESVVVLAQLVRSINVATRAVSEYGEAGAYENENANANANVNVYVYVSGNGSVDVGADRRRTSWSGPARRGSRRHGTEESVGESGAEEGPRPRLGLGLRHCDGE